MADHKTKCKKCEKKYFLNCFLIFHELGEHREQQVSHLHLKCFCKVQLTFEHFHELLRLITHFSLFCTNTLKFKWQMLFKFCWNNRLFSLCLLLYFSKCSMYCCDNIGVQILEMVLNPHQTGSQNP